MYRNVENCGLTTSSVKIVNVNDNEAFEEYALAA
jgi:hypothetical protein